MTTETTPIPSSKSPAEASTLNAGRCAVATGSAPTAEQIAMTRSALNGAKLRAGGKMTINTTTMTTRVWPIIEVWVKAKRQYLPLSVGDVWRYETHAARDAVLSALQNDQGQTRSGENLNVESGEKP